jgi:hypothetical protein
MMPIEAQTRAPVKQANSPRCKSCVTEDTEVGRLDLVLQRAQIELNRFRSLPNSTCRLPAHKQNPHENPEPAINSFSSHPATSTCLRNFAPTLALRSQSLSTVEKYSSAIAIVDKFAIDNLDLNTAAMD